MSHALRTRPRVLLVESCPVCGSPPAVCTADARLFRCGAALNDAGDRRPCAGPIADPVLAELRMRCRDAGHLQAAATLRRSLSDKRCPPARSEASLCDALATLIAASSGSARRLLESVQASIDEDRWP